MMSMKTPPTLYPTLKRRRSSREETRGRTQRNKRTRGSAASAATHPGRSPGLCAFEEPPAAGAFDLGHLFHQERARVDARLDMLRVQITLLQSASPMSPAGSGLGVVGSGVAAASHGQLQPTEPTTSNLPVGHPLEEFVSQCLDVCPWARSNCGSIARAYKKWTGAHGHTPFNHIRFAREMSILFPRKGCVNRVVYTGISLKAAAVPARCTPVLAVPNVDGEESLQGSDVAASDSPGCGALQITVPVQKNDDGILSESSCEQSGSDEE